MNRSMFFKDIKGNYCVCISQEIHRDLIELCEKSNPKETGGILIGKYSEDQTTANIMSLVPPPGNSIAKHFSFFRGNKGLLKILDKAWNNGEYYLGEWHYHPNSKSIPSGQDIQQMHELSKFKCLHCPEPILIIVGGNSDKWEINVMVFTNSKKIDLFEI